MRTLPPLARSLARFVVELERDEMERAKAKFVHGSGLGFALLPTNQGLLSAHLSISATSGPAICSLPYLWPRLSLVSSPSGLGCRHPYLCLCLPFNRYANCALPLLSGRVGRVECACVFRNEASPPNR